MFKIIKKKKIEMIILVLFFCLMIVGCSSLESRQQNISDSVFLSDEPSYYLTLNEKDELTDISLITAIVDVINKNANMVDVYKAIPEKYKTNLSLYDFTVYLSILENEKGYRVSEFYRLNDEKKAELNSNLTTDMPSLALLTQKTEYYIFSFRADSSQLDDYTVIIGIQHDDDGNPYLSDKWIQSINNLNEFSKIYFDSIEKQDSDMLAWLFTQSYEESPSDQMAKIDKDKADLLINYYRLQVKTSPKDSIPIVLLPNKMSFLQNLEIQNNDGKEYRTCTFSQKNDVISISDPYPEMIKNMHLNVYYKDEFLLSWSNNGIRQTYYSYPLNDILGEPSIIKTSLSTSLDENDNYWRITYPEISLIIRGTADSKDKSWSGVIERIEMDAESKNISLGEPKTKEGAIYIGMSLSDFYSQYPFSPEADYIIPGKDQNEKMEMVVQVNKESVQSLILRSVY